MKKSFLSGVEFNMKFRLINEGPNKIRHVTIQGATCIINGDAGK